MGQVNDLMRYCIKQYHAPKRCKQCVNENQCSNSYNCYEVCIKKIHRVTNTELHYNCPNMLHCYVLKHFYRYASEIESVFERYFNAFSGHINVASIGCGPSSELYGMQDYLEKHPEQSISFDFYGFDIDNIWKPIWDYSVTRIPSSHFYTEDFFNYYENKPLPEVIFVNYMLSDMSKYNQELVPVFLDNLIALIERMPYGIIIINDISYVKDDLSMAYGCIHNIHKKIRNNKSYTITAGSFQKLPLLGKYFGSKIDDDSIRMDMIPIPFGIDPFPCCGSLQYIIQKNRQK